MSTAQDAGLEEDDDPTLDADFGTLWEDADKNIQNGEDIPHVDHEDDGKYLWASRSFESPKNDSSSDICRICHMGGFPSRETSRRVQSVAQVDSQISNLSSYSYLGPLISPCKCRGTVALVHAECIERWLTESGRTRCELCGHRYAAKRIPRHGVLRSVLTWLASVMATRQMLRDVLYLLVTTPLAMFSCYVCALTLKLLLRNGLYKVPWMILAMLPTCSLTIIAYWGWVITLGRLHGRRWRRYWRNNFVVRLSPDGVVDEPRNSMELLREEDFADWRNEWTL
ncbi:hypothetical protein KM043_001146 [Ampulex compressa]|nr:hypothetical protein KM043_001146 [Ampulex compressa]